MTEVITIEIEKRFMQKIALHLLSLFGYMSSPVAGLKSGAKAGFVDDSKRNTAEVRRRLSD